MNVLNIYDPQNTWIRRLGPAGTGWKGFFKADGDEFERQAKKAHHWYGRYGKCELKRLQGKDRLEKRQFLFHSLDHYKNIEITFDRINFFMHGHPRSLNRGMIKQGVSIEEFCKRLKAIAAPDCKIVFNSCKTGKLDDGFAATVSQLTELDVIGHTTSGHTTKNPYKRVFAGDKRFYLNYKSLWKFGGARTLKKRLWASDQAPFEFVEEVFRGE